ncbi:MAG: 50S ribosomal protein L11 [Candidatus Doudnabacteria bacterium RIFCSPLOWO2_01_FULL_44_21]|uniref:Large ribosomal subunit protein uL11 n=1 Tax=Candidatus Doudnabacteria bacterium RIFCSPLOWO2_01_FULL_44_21 TaxID=1817841 RepID=A0A1F5PWN2_9BACT|nr:MAG: 50S ribosomal protein L11 [Candidatus Doudnabacteria bacterium RIFCSPHIGHO2_02_FULL_43_13b]OGE94361.1 MAG: 50S ribosomal protein L11 [Candidatus Doudnabacteria bacterium RIFCSPLOWO2_01_FULL_44_21]
MAKKVKTIVKIVLQAGKATPSQQTGTALGPHGLNIGQFLKEFNERTANMGDVVVPAEITIFEDRSYTFVLKTPPASVLIRKAAGIEKGSGDPLKNKVGSISKAQLRAIAEQKMPDLNASTLEAAERIVAGTARSMGVEIKQ